MSRSSLPAPPRRSLILLEAGLEPGSNFRAVRAALAEIGIPADVYDLVPDRAEPLVQTLDDDGS